MSKFRKFKISERVTESNDNVHRYLDDISGKSYDPISPEREVELINRVKDGDELALQMLTKSNLRFVVSVAKSYQGNGLSLNDLINEGNIGLIKAIHRFDETRGFKLITFAVWWIRQSITESLSTKRTVIRMPLNHINLMNKINKSSKYLYTQYGYEPSIQEISLDTGISEIDIHNAFMLNNNGTDSLDKPIGEKGESKLEEILPNDMYSDSNLCEEDNVIEVNSHLNNLSDRDRDIMSKLYGIGGMPPKTMETIAEEYGMTKERIRQINKSSVNKLRDLIK